MFGPDGRLFAAQPAKKRIVSYGAEGGEQVVAAAVDAQHLAVTSKGLVYFTDPSAKRIWLLDKDRKKRIVFQNTAENAILRPAGLRLSPDEHLVNVTDAETRWVWSMQIGPDNGLRYGMAFHHLESPDDTQVTEAAGVTIDDSGHLFVATKLGIQICDAPGRVVGIVRKPQPGRISGVVFGGEGLHTLYATAGDKVYARRMRRTGTLPWVPVKLPRPQL
jgi:sugar lactone lactonase YvrE